MSDSFERLLARSERRETAPADACPEAETLSAYLDGGLQRTERVRVERHAATCARCALTLAAVVRVEDQAGDHGPAAEATLPWWRRWEWLVPAATVAVLGAVWVSLPGDLRQGVEPSAVERTPREAEADASAPRAATAPPAANLEPAAPNAFSSAPKGQSREEGARQDPGQVPARSPGQLSPIPTDLQERRTAGRQSSPARPTGAIQTDADTDVQDRLAAGDAAGSSGANRAAAEKESAPAPAAGAFSAGQEAAAGPGAARAVPGVPPASPHALATPASPVFEAPGGVVAWRVVGARIERTTDGGGTWVLDQPVVQPQRVLAGAAISDDVCWLAGNGGLVLRRSPPGTWSRVTAPTQLPLVAVTAASATEAVVTASDGRRYATTDGGANWR